MKNILNNSNFRFTKWCVVLVAAGWMGMASSTKAQEIIAGWDFQTTTSGGTAVVASPNTQTIFSANVGSGTLYLNGSEGSSAWTSATELNAFGGTATNAVNGLSTVTTSPSALALLGGTGNAANGKSISFKFSMTGKKDLQISFAGQRTATGFTTQVWEYSANGTTWSPVGTISSGTTTGTMTTSFANSGVLSLPTITGLDTAATAYVRVTFSGATAASGNSRIDNFRFMATTFSAPTTPSAPVVAVPSGITTSGFTANWAASSGATKYFLDVATDSGFTSFVTGYQNKDVENVTSSAVMSLNAGTTYYYRVRANNSAGTSASSEAQTALTTAAGTPSVTVSPTSATGLTNYVGQVSASTNYTVTGTNLGGTNVVVTASTNAIEISTNSSTGYTNSFSLAPSVDGTLTNVVYVRISALAPAGAVSATVSNVSGVASNNFTVSGTVTQPALTLVLATNSVAENAGANATTGTVGIPASLGTDLVVNLVSTNTAAATVPSTVTITNGQTNATFAIAAVASSGSYQPQTTAIQASNSNYTTASATLTVTNVDVPPAPLAAKGWINELHYDNTGTDAGEFVEIILADTTPTTNVSVILYNGGTAGSFIPYGTASDLASFTKGVSANGYTIYSKSFPVDGIQNGGTDGIALIIDNVVEEFISYEGSAVATSGAAAGYTSIDIGISEGSEAAGGSLYRYGPGSVGRDFAWAKATVATPGQVNPGQNLGATGVQGTGTLAIANGTASSAFVTQNIFPKATAGQTVSLTLTGTLSSGTISSMSVVVPAAFTGLSAGNVTVSGTGAGTPVTTLSGSTLTITGLVVDQLNPVTINIAGLTTPETAGDLTKDGNYPFTIQTGVDGNLQPLLIQPIAVVTIPIANLGDVDANGVSLDEGKTVAVQGVCTEENFNSSNTTSAYLQSGQPNGVLKAGINIFSGQRNLFVRGDEYVVAGSVLNYNGLTELVVSSAGQVVRLGTATAVPTPVTLTIAELTAAHEAYEGSLVRVVGLSKVSGTWALTVVGNVTSGSNVTLANGGVNLTTRLNVGSAALTEPIYPAAITGVYGQFVAASPFTGGGQIQPRDQADIEDAPGLRLTFAEAYLYESTTPPLGGAIVSGALTVSRTGGDTSAALVVALSPSPTGLLQFPASVTIPVGQETATVTVEAIDNSGFNAAGFTNVTLTASALGSGLGDGSTTVMILEDEASAPADTIKPIITLIGANPQLVANGAVYADLKATVTDNVDASREITGTGTVNTAVAGDYTITYNASDAAGNAAIAVTRTVRVAAPLGTTYSGWLGQAGASDAAFLDYVFGAVTPGTLDPSLRPTVAVSGGNLVLTYNVRQGTSGLTVTPKTSADLAAGPSGWVTTDVTVADVGAARSVNGVSVQQKTASVPVSGAKKFLRVEAVQQ
jgi:hypothetical protein